MPSELTFSVDTLLFDTVFTSMGSTTRTVMLYNRSKTDFTIEAVAQSSQSVFRLNLDGENDVKQMRQIPLPAGDSLYLFVRAYINPQNVNGPVLISDEVTFSLSNGSTQTLHMEAYGQDVVLIDSLYLDADYHFSADKPYLVRYYIASDPDAKVTIDPGCTFYMHKGAYLHFYGDLDANGTAEQPITFCSDRLDHYLPQVPYAYVPGMWSGIYLYDHKGVSPTWNIRHAAIISAGNGLFCYGQDYNARPHLTLESSRIHNHDQYGLILQNVDAVVGNSEISNCASYCVYMSGGDMQLVHNTIAGYYRHTNYSSFIYDTPREDVASVYINNINKERPTTVSFYNNIIAGVRKNQLYIASPLPEYYSGRFVGNCLQTDSLHLRNAERNVYLSTTDTVFRNTFYKDSLYYDFRLDSLSPAHGIADSAAMTLYPTDITGTTRTTRTAGCYAE